MNSISQLLKLILIKKAIINRQYKNIIIIKKIILSNFFVFSIHQVNLYRRSTATDSRSGKRSNNGTVQKNKYVELHHF